MSPHGTVAGRTAPPVGRTWEPPPAAARDEGKGGIPGTKQVEEAADPHGIQHARHGEPRAEQQAGGKTDHAAHHQPPPTALTIATVTKPVAMKVNVATMDRFDRRDMPHTP